MATKKIIVTNFGALRQKYGECGFGAIQTAIQQLITADKTRGILTTVIALDDLQDMRRVNGLPVLNPANPHQNKDAVDAIYHNSVPEYILLLGGPDIIPHQDLLNPLYTPDDLEGDLDEFAYGDLPYACEAGYSQRPEDFIGATRVIGRLPDIVGRSNPDYLITLLGVAAQWTERPSEDYRKCFGLTAGVWRQSTALSLTKTFGSQNLMKVVPPDGPRWSKTQLSRLSHFINCHGSPSTPTFYGQPTGEKRYPVAHLASWIDGRISPGTVAAAECCYGAELYDPGVLENGQIGICSTYLSNGGYGFFGSTTIAYGLTEGNADADLICQFFFKEVLAGSSLGRAALEARQRFAQTSSALGPDELKTLAQYILLGDPSIQPVTIPLPNVPMEHAGVKMHLVPLVRMLSEDRVARRQRLLVRGTQIKETQAFAIKRLEDKADSGVYDTLRKIARSAGIISAAIISYNIMRPRFTNQEALLALAAKIPTPSSFHVAIGRVDAGLNGEDKRGTVPGIVLIIAQEQEGTIVSVRELHSR